MQVGWTGFLEPLAGRRYLTAWDIGRRHDATWGITIDWSEAPYQAVASERLVGVPYPGIQDMISARGLAYGGRTYVETNGPGDPVLENLGIRATGFVTTARSKVDAITALQMLVERGMLKADIPQLDRELRVYRWDDRDLVQDGVMALAIAAYHLPRVERGDSTYGEDLRVRYDTPVKPQFAGVRDIDW